MHPYDRFFFDPQTNRYTVQREHPSHSLPTPVPDHQGAIAAGYLQDLRDRYGGVDSILLWPTYTNIGADDRSQFDLYEALPGGLPALKQAVDELHAAGVKVLLA